MFKVVSAASLALVAAQTQNIVQIAQATPELRLLVDALVAGNLVSALQGPGPFTVVAPVNTGFEALGRNVLDFVLNAHNQKALQTVLTYHVANGAVFSKDLKDGQMIPTLETESLTVHINGATVKFNDATVLRADIAASNGVIHLIDAVEIPTAFPGLPKLDIVQTAQSVSALSTLVTAVVTANVTADLSMPRGPYTVFAPTNDAFAALPAATLAYLLAHPVELREVLFYHVLDHRVYSEEIKPFGVARTLEGEEIVFIVDGGKVLVNGNATVTTANVDCANGVVHVIDEVLIPKAVGERISQWQAPALPNIVQLAQSVPSLSTLVTAVVAGGLADTLSNTSPLTVFAPNNQAFDRLPNGVLAYLLANPKALDDVLTYHVVSGNVTSSMLKNDEIVPTLQGGNVTIHIAGRLVLVNDAHVIAADNFASNGVVHIIDRVLLPAA